jgi:hypothetical protein
MALPDITKIPAPRTPVINEQSGDMTPAWYRFLYNIYISMGSGSGVLPVNRGGTGQSSYTDGQLLIGNSIGNTLTKNTLTPGQNIGVTNGNGSIEIAFDGILPIANGGTDADNATDARTNLGAAASGANSDITSMSGLTGGISTPDYIAFDTTPETVPTAPGSLYWDAADGNQTLSLVMANGDAIQQIGEEQYYRIKASAPITEGQLVMFTGTVGASGGLKGAPASGLTATTSSYIMGIATHTLGLNEWGYITSFGLVRGINTTGGAEAWVDGQILYYNPAVAGGLTKTVPTAPNAKVQVCAVVHAAANGSLFVRPTFGGALGQYEGDVQITAPAANQVLTYTASNRWENLALSAVAQAITTKTAGYTVTANDYTVLCNATSAAFAVTLPDAATLSGKVYNVKKIDSSVNAVTITPTAPDLIDGSATAVLLTQWTSLTFQSDGSNWYIL